MELETVGLVFRGCERLIVVIAAFSAVWFGYRLFDRIVSDKSSFEGKVGEWSIKLQRVAPGVFFALFGVGVLMLALASPFKHEPGSVADGSAPSTSYSNEGLESSQQTRDQATLGAVSSVLSLLGRPKVYEKFEKPDQDVLRAVTPQLIVFRDTLIDTAYGPGWRERYYSITDALRTDAKALDKLSPDDAKKFHAIQSAMSPVRSLDNK